MSEFPSASDHYIIDFSIRVKFHRVKPVRRKVYDLKKGKFAELRSSLEHVPFDIAFSENIDEYWLTWKDLFLTVVSECIPVKTAKDTNSPPWIDTEEPDIVYERNILRWENTDIGKLQPTTLRSVRSLKNISRDRRDWWFPVWSLRSLRKYQGDLSDNIIRASLQI